MRTPTKALTLLVATLLWLAPSTALASTQQHGNHRYSAAMWHLRAHIRLDHVRAHVRLHNKTHHRTTPSAPSGGGTTINPTPSGGRTNTNPTGSPTRVSGVASGATTSSDGSGGSGGGDGTGGGSGGSTSGGSTPFFDGTFTSPDDWPSVYGSCSQTLNNTSVQFNITSSCDPGNDGHDRTDLCSSRGCTGNGTIAEGDVYQADEPTCTSVPVDATNVPTVPNSTWMMFAEMKDYSASTGGWAFMLNSYYSGVNQLAISFGTGYSNTSWDGPITPGWHTLSICTNNANDSAGEVYGIYEDGVRLTFNHGDGAGQQSVGGWPIINNRMSSWPLDIDDYTGGSVPNTIMTGAALVSAGTANPPMPSGGWTSS